MLENRETKMLFALAVTLVAVVVFFRFSDIGANFMISMSGSGLILPFVVIASLVDSINPCAFSVLLITIAFLLSLGRDRKNILKLGGVYVFGVFAVYILIGFGILRALSFFGMPHFMSKLGASIIIFAGALSIINELFPAFPLKLKIPKFTNPYTAQLLEKGTAPALFLTGALVGLFEFPCTGGPYLMILGLLHDNATFVSGAWYLLLYNLIFVLPLIVILFLASDGALLARVDAWRRSSNYLMRFGGGAVMIFLGILILIL